MDISALKRYFLVCGASPSDISDKRLKAIMKSHDTDELGRLTNAGFLEFYNEAAIQRPDSVWKDLTKHDFNERLGKIGEDLNDTNNVVSST